MDGERYNHPQTGEGLLLTGTRREFALLHMCLEAVSQSGAGLDFATQEAASRAKDATNMALSYPRNPNVPYSTYSAHNWEPEDEMSVHYTDYLAGRDAPAGRAHSLAVRMVCASMGVAAQAGEQEARGRMLADLVQLDADLMTCDAVPNVVREQSA